MIGRPPQLDASGCVNPHILRMRPASSRLVSAVWAKACFPVVVVPFAKRKTIKNEEEKRSRVLSDVYGVLQWLQGKLGIPGGNPPNTCTCTIRYAASIAPSQVTIKSPDPRKSQEKPRPRHFQSRTNARAHTLSCRIERLCLGRYIRISQLGVSWTCVGFLGVLRIRTGC